MKKVLSKYFFRFCLTGVKPNFLAIIHESIKVDPLVNIRNPALSTTTVHSYLLPCCHHQQVSHLRSQVRPHQVRHGSGKYTFTELSTMHTAHEPSRKLCPTSLPPARLTQTPSRSKPYGEWAFPTLPRAATTTRASAPSLTTPLTRS